MHSRSARAAAALVVCVVIAGCTGGDDGSPTDPGAARMGGTLELTMFAEDFAAGADHPVTLDPARETTPQGVELLRCCLARTLMTYAVGGALVPDLAEAPPTVSKDGMTWTFHLRPGLTYAPPLEEVPITSQDLDRALTRVARLASTSRIAEYFASIAGFQAVADGAAATITGLSEPNARTLVIMLSRPTGDLADRLSLPAASALPPQLGALMEARPSLPFGDYLVSTGPYSFEAADQAGLNPASPQPAIGLSSASSITLVRNPSWDRSEDPTRAAYVDRIHITVGGTATSTAALVDGDEADLQFEGGTATPSPLLRAYEEDPELRGRFVSWDRASVWAVSMNLAVPPFDDVHVRRAVGFAMNTDDLVRAALTAEGSAGTIATGDVAKHLVPDSAEAGLLSAFDPFPGHKGDERRSKARTQLEESPYATDRDGNCTDVACAAVSIAIDGSDASRRIAETLRKDLHAIGIKLADPTVADGLGPAGSAHVALFVSLTRLADYPNASTLFLPLLSSEVAADPSAQGDPSMLGVPPETLLRLGYDVTEVATIDDRIRTCIPLTGTEQIDCWALLDKYVMLEIVPWVPFFIETYSAIVSSRLRSVHADPLTQVPAIDRLWIERSASAA